MKHSLLSILFGMSVLTAYAQNMLNIHQKSGGVVSYGFADKPVLTYLGDNLRVSTNSVIIDYPLSELEKMTFSDSKSSIAEIRIEDSYSQIQIYDTNGRLIKIIGGNEYDTVLNIQEFPIGIYFIKQGTITTKIIKQ